MTARRFLPKKGHDVIRQFPRLPVNQQHNATVRCLIAVIASGIGLAAWALFGQALEPSPFSLLFVAVSVSALYGGTGPGFLATFIALPGALFLYSPLRDHIVGGSIRDAVHLAVFSLAGASVTVLVNALRHAQERAEAALAAYERSREEKELILSTLAHDLRNPLTAIKSIAYVQRRRLTTQDGEWVEPTRASLEHINDAATRIASLLQQLEDAFRSKPDDGNAGAIERINLTALVCSMVGEYEDVSDKHRLVLHDRGGEAIVGMWDRTGTVRVFDNLLSNAIKYSPEGGQVCIELDRERDATGAWAVVTIRDEGMGIPAAEIEHVFNPLYRGSNVHGKVAGKGLGLAGACRIVEHSGGTINIESAEGMGTTVRVRLPLDSATAALP